jgi:hypothetical protein
MKNRTILKIDELEAILNSELSKIEGSEGATVKLQYKLKEPDESGCNWSDTITLATTDNAQTKYINSFLGQIIVNARKRYNIE